MTEYSPLTKKMMRAEMIQWVVNIPDHLIADAYEALRKLTPSRFRRILDDLDTLERQVSDLLSGKRDDEPGSRRKGVEVHRRLQRVADDLKSDASLSEAQKAVLDEQLQNILNALLHGLFDLDTIREAETPAAPVKKAAPAAKKAAAKKAPAKRK